MKSRKALIVLITLPVVVASIAVYLVINRTYTHLKTDIASSDVRQLGEALGTFRMECGRYPTTQEGFAVLRINPGIKYWNGPYGNAKLTDPWGRPYRYELKKNATKNFTLATLGADGEPGGEGIDADISFQ